MFNINFLNNTKCFNVGQPFYESNTNKKNHN